MSNKLQSKAIVLTQSDLNVILIRYFRMIGKLDRDKIYMGALFSAGANPAQLRFEADEINPMTKEDPNMVTLLQANFAAKRMKLPDPMIDELVKQVEDEIVNEAKQT